MNSALKGGIVLRRVKANLTAKSFEFVKWKIVYPI